MAALLELVDVDFAYGSLQVLFGVSLAVKDGEILGLLGTNGAGKSTVLRVLSGLAPPPRGALRFADRDITGLPAERIASLGIVQVPGGRAIFPDLSVVENLVVGAHLVAKAERRSRIGVSAPQPPGSSCHFPVAAPGIFADHRNHGPAKSLPTGRRLAAHSGKLAPPPEPDLGRSSTKN